MTEDIENGCMKLPCGAGGLPLHLGDRVVLLDGEGDMLYLVESLLADGSITVLDELDRFPPLFVDPSRVKRVDKVPDEADFWDALERDALLGVDAYRAVRGLKDNGGMSWPQAVRLDLVRRARAFAQGRPGDGADPRPGIEEVVDEATVAAGTLRPRPSSSSSGSSPCRERLVELERQVADLELERDFLLRDLRGIADGDTVRSRDRGGRGAHER